MPTLTATSRLENVLRSFNAFVKEEIEVGMSLEVHYHGGGRLNISQPSTIPLEEYPPQWLEVYLMELSPQSPVMVTGTQEHGVILDYQATINQFVKTDAIMNGTLSIYTPTRIMDQIAALFRPPTGSIPVYDYDTVGTPFVGALQPRTTPARTEVPTPTGMGIRQWSLSSTLHQISASID